MLMLLSWCACCEREWWVRSGLSCACLSVRCAVKALGFWDWRCCLELPVLLFVWHNFFSSCRTFICSYVEPPLQSSQRVTKFDFWPVSHQGYVSWCLHSAHRKRENEIYTDDSNPNFSQLRLFLHINFRWLKALWRIQCGVVSQEAKEVWAHPRVQPWKYSSQVRQYSLQHWYSTFAQSFMDISWHPPTWMVQSFQMCTSWGDFQNCKIPNCL